MEVFYKIIDALTKIPQAVALTAPPILLLVCGFLFAAFGFRGAYQKLAVGLTAAGYVLVACHDLSCGFIYLGLMALLSVLVGLFFYIPFGRKTPKETGDELYEKFHRPLDISEEELLPEAEEETELCGAADVRLSHARELVETLKKSELSASDRLEADALSRTLESFGDKELSPEETRSLNDCLATILKLTAKYKL